MNAVTPTAELSGLEQLRRVFDPHLERGAGAVRAEGKVIHAGCQAALAEGRLTDAQGRLCATATSTLLVFDR
jgi:acyl-coenzyme A thioesterase PaaI-like protein